MDFNEDPCQTAQPAHLGVRIEVLVASADRPVLRMLLRFLASFAEIAVVGQAGNAVQMWERTAALRPEVLLVDVGLLAPLDDGTFSPELRTAQTAVVAVIPDEDQESLRARFAYTVRRTRLGSELMGAIRAAAEHARKDRTSMRDADEP
jgi:DNA-binding NarL/FixJ family response regulator